MSDLESYRSDTSHSRDVLGRSGTPDDQHLNDHRNQPASLPPRKLSVSEGAPTGSGRHQLSMGSLRRDYLIGQHDDDDEEDASNFAQQPPVPIYKPQLSNRSSSMHPPTPLITSTSGGILMNKLGGNAPASTSSTAPSRKHSVVAGPLSGGGTGNERSNTLNAPPSSGRRPSFDNDDGGHNLSKVRTVDTVASSRHRRPSNATSESEVDSRALRSSQETEEDVCFPMVRDHVRVKGIDFDEIEEFINSEREEQIYRQHQMAMNTDILKRTTTSGGVIKRSGLQDGKQTGGFLEKIRSRAQNIVSSATGGDNVVASDVSQNLPGAIPTDPLANDNISIQSSAISRSSSHDDDILFMEKKSTNRFPGITSQKVVNDTSSSDNVNFGGTTITEGGPTSLPDRFSFFTSDSDETVHAPDMQSLLAPGETVRELFKNGECTWWLDCSCPTDSEMKMLAKAFGIHPLTAEDIRMQETREKVELFRNYYFVCFHTFEPDKESEEYLEPINVYIVVFREGIMTFHFSPIPHAANVRRRVRQLRDYVDVSADWICYAIIDDITDGFAPVIQSIEYEADAIEDLVLFNSTDFSTMLRRIGEARRKVMTLMRLLSGKADVIKMFAKRCQDEFSNLPPNYIPSNVNLSSGYPSTQVASSPPPTGTGTGTGYHHSSSVSLNAQNSAAAANAGTHSYSSVGGNANPGVQFGPGPGAHGNFQYLLPNQIYRAQPRADIALYLGDIQDHVVTMFQNLVAYEKIFSRAHSNYLAQLQVESFNANNKVTKMFSKITLLGTILIPLNLVTGLFGMNVTIPGETSLHPGLGWFFGIVGVMIFFITVSTYLSSLWLKSVNDTETTNVAGSSRSIKSLKSLGLRSKKKLGPAKSIISFPDKYD
ncbi:Mg(2+) transporter [Scheffersomyces spartinae]|uniref:Mg(2+) transporter n=1 Tax=Scheffersomyces spartinae TaxID=45513 RepID=A0A9P7V7D6_9ASCO|nr:Mg(2+) transporter [Scheffersomyces spartinae]KAG7192585.1 Mg(2+) transporter [Scheffersomyces spartinae]